MSYDLVIVGMGSGGLSAAEFAAGLGLRVAAVERARLGGDCLWTGCVPSKALLATAKVAHTMRTAHRVGITAVEPEIDLPTVWRRVRAVQAEIAATDDNPHRYRDLGVELHTGQARLTGPTQVTVRHDDGTEAQLDTRFVLLCTGSRPHIPTVDGLDESWCLTSETVFQLVAPPASVAIIGGGPMGVEMAQALQRLGVNCTILQRAHTLLPREEPSLVARLAEVLDADGVVVHTNADVRSLRRGPDGTVQIHAIVGDTGHHVRVDAGGVLLAAGRTPTTEGLGLEELGIAVNVGGIEVDPRGRTAVRTVYAAGDVAGRRLLTNAAGYEAVRAVRDMFFPGKASRAAVIPSCVFTDPELASVGLSADQAEAAFGADTDVWRIDLTHNDRARTDARDEGSVMVVTAKGRIVGAHVLAPAAGEMIHELSLAIHRELRLDELAESIHVYPTLSGAIGQLATESAYEKALRLRWLMKRR
jgi:pyruvate/2-oxoglutarate dehydrogenase complex dihydrolipoamide dehydrogenase (E3) component